MALKYYYSDITGITTNAEIQAILSDMYSRALTWEQQKKNIIEQLRFVLEQTPWKNDNGAADKQGLINAFINNFIMPVLENLPTAMQNRTPNILPSNNPDDYEWTLKCENGCGIFNGDYSDSYGYRGNSLYLYGKARTSMPTYQPHIWNGRYIAQPTNPNTLILYEILSPASTMYIRSDTINPYTYRYWNTHTLPSTVENVLRYEFSTRAVHFPVLFSQVEGYYLTGSSLGSSESGGNPNGDEESTSGKYPSGEMGGLGTFDDTTDLSDISSKPSLNISDLGFFSIWNPSSAQLRNLADYVWNDPLNVQQWPQIFQSGILKPLDYIMSLSLFPLSPQQLTLSSKTFCMGGIVFDGRLSALGKNITMNQVTEQIIDVDMGTLSLKEYFGSFLDYSPYSQVSLYLPYYQTVQLSMNELQNADSINIRYRINLLDGSTSIKVHIDRQTSAAQNGSVPMKHVLYEFFTNLKTDIPLTSGQNTEQMKMLATVMAGAAAVVAAPIAGAGASALAGAAEGAATIGGMEGASIGAQVGNSAVGQAVSGAIKTGAGAANKAINSLPSGGGIQRGNIGGMNNGLLSERRPFLIVTRPIQVLPLNYQGMEGYPASINTTLTALGEGFVKCESVDMTGLTATANEKGAILEALSGGVFI